MSVNYTLIKINNLFPYHIIEIKADFSNSICHFLLCALKGKIRESFSKFHFMVIEVMCLIDSLIHRNYNTVYKKLAHSGH